MQEYSKSLKIPQQFKRLLSGKYDVVLVLLGKEYLAACFADGPVNTSSPVIFFAPQNAKLEINPAELTEHLVITRADTTTFGASMFCLKGKILLLYAKATSRSENWILFPDNIHASIILKLVKKQSTKKKGKI